MHVIVELWKGRPGWFQCGPAERAAYLERVAPAIRELLADGVELVAIGAAPQREEPGDDYDYWAVWRFPDQDHLLSFTHAIESVGWHERFERVNTGFEGRALEDILPFAAAPD